MLKQIIAGKHHFDEFVDVCFWPNICFKITAVKVSEKPVQCDQNTPRTLVTPDNGAAT